IGAQHACAPRGESGQCGQIGRPVVVGRTYRDEHDRGTHGGEEGRGLELWVGFQPASRMGQPRWSLAASSARTSVFDAHEFGTDQRQRPVRTPLFERNFLTGGVPGSGKSYAARTLALIAALDTTCELKIAEFKGTADFGDLAPICSTYVCGVDDQALADGA